MHVIQGLHVRAHAAQTGVLVGAQGLSQEDAEALRKEAAAANLEVVLLGDHLAAKEEELGAAQAQLAQLAEQLKAAGAEAAHLSDALSSRCDVLQVYPRS